MMLNATGCLDENTALGFVEGRLPAARVAVVDAHLATCALCREVVAGAVGIDASAAAANQAQAASAPSAQALSRGTTIGRYVVLDLVGRGAMGEVYAAFDPELNRKIALKLIKSDGAESGSPEVARRRLLREAQAIARLSHPNIVVVHDAGTLDERVFIAMEFVEGQTLHDWLRAEARPWRDVVEVLVAAGRGLGAAHAAGLVHRDFKPHNVMVANDGSIRVMDFGLASDRDVAAREPEAHAGAAVIDDDTSVAATRLTRTGTLLGTPAYMAPEQFLAQPTDERSDQFSFCVALYEGLYGERPFAGATTAELARSVTTGEVRAAPARSRVPSRLRRILLRGLSRAREQRFPSMSALLDQLSRDPLRPRRIALVVATAAVALTLGGLAVQRKLERPEVMCGRAADRLVDVWGGASPARRDAVHAAFVKAGAARGEEAWRRVSVLLDQYASAWIRMSTDSCEATHVRGGQSAAVLDLRTACLDSRRERLRALTDIFAAADRGVVTEAVNAANALPDLAACADVKALTAVTPPPADRRTRARVEALRKRTAEVSALADAGKITAAISPALSLVDEARALAYEPTLAEAARLACWLEDKDGQLVAAAPLCEQAVWAAEASRDDDDGAQAATALVPLTLARPEESRRWARLATAILERMGPGHERIESWLAHNEGFVAIERGDAAAARPLFERAVALKTAVYGPDHPDVAMSLNSLGNALRSLGEIDRGLEVIERAERIYERAYGGGSSYLMYPLVNEGEILNEKGRYQDALVPLERAQSLIDAEFGPESRWAAFSLTARGISLVGLGRSREAASALEAALAIRERLETPALLVAETRFALARALWDAPDRRERALQLADGARAALVRSDKPGKALAEIDAWLKDHRRPSKAI